MNPRALLGGLVTVGLIGAAIYFKKSRQSETSTETHDVMVQAVHGMPCYEKNKKVLDASLEVAHQQAFDAAYSTGGRRTSGRLDDEKYVQKFFDCMCSEVKKRGKPELEKELQALGTVMVAAVKG
jgi:hypothetical protein